MKKVLPIFPLAAAFAVFVGASVSHPAPASAASEDFGLRIQPEGFESLEEAARALVPEEIPLEDLETEVLGCAIHLEEGDLEAGLEDAEFELDEGALRAHVEIHLDAAAEVDVCSGTMTCTIEACANPVAATLDLELSESADGWIEAGGAEADLALSPGEFDVTIENCAAGDLLSSIREAVDEWLLVVLRPLAEHFAGNQLADAIAGLVSDSIPRSLEADGFEIQASVSRFDLGPQRGLVLEGSADVSSRGSGSGAGGSAPEGEPVPSDFGPGEFGVAASDRLVNRALFEAWDAGLLELALSEAAPTVPLDEAGLADQLGLSPGAEIDVSFGFGEAPETAFSREGAGASIRLEDLGAEIAISEPGASPDTLKVKADAYLRASASVSESGAFILEPEELELSRLAVESGASGVAADPARLERFLEGVGVPLLADQLAELPIAPALSPTDGVYIWMRNLEAEDGWLRAGLDLVVPDPEDTRPPTTELVDPPDVVGAGLGRIRVTGEDATTPTPLLRYEARLDGEPITDGPEFLDAVSISAADGEYTLEVAAVDLAGNVDPDPVRHRIVVDGDPPELEVLEAPDHTVRGEVYASWRASDARGGVQTEWALFSVGPRGAADERLGRGEKGAEGEVTLENLDSGKTYILRITAEDEAGNLTSEEFGFGGVSGGCAAAGTAAGAPLPWALAGLVLLLVARQRRKGAAIAFAALAALPLARSASAQGVGTHFSSAADADGASAFWNPAAMMRGEDTHLSIASGLSLIRMRYEADTGDRSSTFVPKPEPTLGGYTDAAGEDLRFGFTVAAPEIEGASWSRDDGAGDITRYYATSAQSVHITATPAVAYRATPWLSIAGGVRIVRSELRAELDQDIGGELNMTLESDDPDAPLPYAEPVLAAPTDLRASGWGIGLVAGALVEPPAPVKIGLGFHSPSTSRGSGEVRAEYSDEMREFVDDAEPDVELPELAGRIRADLDMPLMAFSAVAIEPAPLWEIVFDYRFLRRSRAQNTDLVVSEATSPTVDDTAVVRGYRNKHGIGFRAQRELPEAGVVGAFRTRYESNSVPEETISPSNLDFHQVEIGGAAKFALSDRIEMIGQYSRFFLIRREVEENLNRPLAEPSLAAFNKPSPTGEYSGVSDYLAVALSTTW